MELSEALMNTLSPFCVLNCPCDEALLWTKKQLLQAGLRALPTFDLHAARLGLADCPCPNHGTEDCDCQMIVMLVYGNAPEPATLILHGNNGQTWFSLVNGSSHQVDPVFRSSIERALQPKISE